jgi:hypothetical protein
MAPSTKRAQCTDDELRVARKKAARHVIDLTGQTPVLPTRQKEVEDGKSTKEESTFPQALREGTERALAEDAEDRKKTTGAACAIHRQETKEDNDTTILPPSFDGHPTRPRVDPLADEDLHGKSKKYIIYMAMQEPPRDAGFTKGVAGFAKGLETCALACSYPVQDACFQRDGTRHVSLWDGVLTDRAASALAFPAALQASFTALPVTIRGWTSWKSGLYLSLADGTTQALQQLLGQLEGLPRGKVACDHLSLYRRRGVDYRTAHAQFSKVRQALASHDWGQVQGVSVRIKVLGSEYDECRVLLGEA